MESKAEGKSKLKALAQNVTALFRRRRSADRRRAAVLQSIQNGLRSCMYICILGCVVSHRSKLDNEIPWPKDLKPPNMPSFVVKNSNSWGCCDLFPSAKNRARDTSATYKTCSQSPCIFRTKRLMNKNEALFERSHRDGLEICVSGP